MQITDLLKRESVELNGSAGSKAEALDKLIQLMVKQGNIADPEEYRKKVFAREEEGSTGVGEGVAIPHAKTAAVTRPGLAFMRCSDGVEFDSLDGAMRKVVERMEGPLIDEFRRMLRDIRMGMTRRRSMQLMAKRCDVQDVYLFVMSVVQSERLGASMSDTLVIQADNMRDLRRQRARTQAMKAPVKMIFPLVFCIFPAIFVVVLLPSLISLMQGMK